MASIIYRAAIPIVNSLFELFSLELYYYSLSYLYLYIALFHFRVYRLDMRVFLALRSLFRGYLLSLDI